MMLALKKVMSKLRFFLSDIKNGNHSYFLWIFPIKKNKIVICNYYGKGYGDNGKYIAEEIQRQNLNFDVVWLVNDQKNEKNDTSIKVRFVKYKSLRSLYELATAKVWIDNCRKTFFPPKRRLQLYIQTWHGGIALKKIEKDAEKSLSSFYIRKAKKDSSNADLFLSNSKFCTEMYKKSFWYTGEIIESGSPRCDIIINKEDSITDKVKEHFKIDTYKKLVLYAPTFRANNSFSAYDIDYNRLLDSLSQKFASDWVVLVRLHPNITDSYNLITYNDNIINATHYDDMYELLCACNILITDYSSSMFEFSLSEKPVILYCNDIDEYKKDRDFYFELLDLPFSIAQNNDELSDIIRRFDIKRYNEQLEEFYNKVGIKETGVASKAVVNYLISRVEA